MEKIDAQGRSASGHPPLLTCLLCDRQLTPIAPDCVDQPYGGTRFDSYGHYGATAFDDGGARYLSSTICDPCLVERAARITVSRADQPGSVPEPWELTDSERAWIEYTSAYHDITPTPLTINGVEVCAVALHNDGSVTIDVNGTWMTVRKGDVIAGDLHVTRVLKAVPTNRAGDPWLSYATVSEGVQPTFDEWFSAHRI